MRAFRTHLEGFSTWLKAQLPPPPPPRGTLPLAFAWPRIVPKVRPRFHYEAFGQRTASRRPETRALGGAFDHSLVVDFSEGEVEVTASHLMAWGMEFNGMMNKAKTNLLARGGEERFERSRHGFYRSTWEDGLDGSRILLPGILRRLRLQGDPVAFLPRKDILLVAGSEDPEGLCRALEGALELLDPGPHDGCPLRLTGFSWEAFEVGENHPASPLLSMARQRGLMAAPAGRRPLPGLDLLDGLAVATAGMKHG